MSDAEKRIDYLDRMIANLKNEQDDLMDEYQQLERVICEYEREADRLENIVNESNNRGISL